MANSRSGRRLRNFESAAGLPIWYDNSTPEVGDNPDSLLPPDLRHVRRVLALRRPRAVVTLGEQARKALSGLWDGPLVALPHPAYRVVTNELYRTAGEMLAGGFQGREILRQRVGHVERMPLAA